MTTVTKYLNRIAELGMEQARVYDNGHHTIEMAVMAAALVNGDKELNSLQMGDNNRRLESEIPEECANNPRVMAAYLARFINEA